MVPLVERRSVSTTCAPSKSSRACRREMPTSARRRLAWSPRPITIEPMGSMYGWPSVPTSRAARAGAPGGGPPGPAYGCDVAAGVHLGGHPEHPGVEPVAALDLDDDVAVHRPALLPDELRLRLG